MLTPNLPAAPAAAPAANPFLPPALAPAAPKAPPLAAAPAAPPFANLAPAKKLKEDKCQVEPRMMMKMMMVCGNQIS